MTANNDAHVSALRILRDFVETSDEEAALDAAIRALSADRGEAIKPLMEGETLSCGPKQYPETARPPPPPTPPRAGAFRTQILQAVARGWCNPSNAHKVMDPTLAEAITDEVVAAISATPPSPAGTPKASWDAKALEVASRIALMWGEDRSQFVAKIQVAVLEAMQWASPADVWMRAIAQVKDESLFADGVSADLHSAGIHTIEDAFMEGRKSVFMEVELEVASRLATTSPAESAEGGKFRFIAKDDMVPPREFNGRGGDGAKPIRPAETAAPSQVSDAMVERAFNAWCDVADVDEYRVRNPIEALRAALEAVQLHLVPTTVAGSIADNPHWDQPQPGRVEGMVLPPRKSSDSAGESWIKAMAWNECLDEVVRLNAAPPKETP